MFRRHHLDDDTIDAVLAGRDPGRDDLAALVGFVKDAGAMTRGPIPVPSSALATVLAEGLSLTDKGDLLVTAANVPGPELQAAGLPKWKRKKMAIAQLLTGLSVGAKAALGVGIAAASVAGAGAAGALPGPAQHAVASAVSAATPFEFPDDANSHADFGKTTSSDATGASDDQKGVNGQSVSSSAAQNGLSTASDTPASDHLPTSLPAGPPASTPPEDAGSQSSNGADTASDTPAEDHLPSSVPPGHP